MAQKSKYAFLFSLVTGLVLAPVLMIVVMYFLPGVGTKVILFPGELLVPVVGPVFGGVVMALAPEGGPGAAVTLFLLGSFLFWWLVFSVGGFFILRWQRRI